MINKIVALAIVVLTAFTAYTQTFGPCGTPVWYQPEEPQPPPSPSMIIDGSCIFREDIPDNWIDSVKANIKMYYVGASHSHQVTEGAQYIEGLDPKFSVSVNYTSLPTESGALCIYHKGGDPKDFWWGDEWRNGPTETRNVLNTYPDINLAMFCWCTHMNYESAEYVSSYCDSMAMLDAEFPNVTFVWLTGNASNYDERGLNRWYRNEEIRSYCIENNKWLFDWANIDSWYYNGNEWVQHWYTYDGVTFPGQYWEYEGASCGHATWTACELKGNALWYMAARIVGWED